MARPQDPNPLIYQIHASIIFCKQDNDVCQGFYRNSWACPWMYVKKVVVLCRDVAQSQRG